MYNYIRISVHTVFVNNMSFKDNIWIYVKTKIISSAFPITLRFTAPLIKKTTIYHAKPTKVERKKVVS